MTVYLAWAAGIAGVALVVLAAPWVLARAARRWGTDDVPITPPRRIYDGHDDRLRIASAHRRERANGFRQAAGRIESGALTLPPKRVIPIGRGR